MSFQPKDYDELIDYITEAERVDYLRLCNQLGEGHITEDWFNKKHNELFKSLRERKEECQLLLIRSLPPELHQVMHDRDKQEFYEMVTAFKRGFITQSEFKSYHDQVVADHKGKIENAKLNDKLMREYDKDDQMAIKLAGGCHADNGIKEHEAFNGKTWERYYTKRGRKIDSREATTFFEV